MISASVLFDQSTLTLLLDHDPVIQRYRTFFSFFDWTVVSDQSLSSHRPGPRPHPETAYIKALLVKLCEHKDT